ncbi:hypothetical protein ACG33_11395 [Steroidobacter denitrificans]|uniref:Steroid 5-alpha reductase C-terminal domain-containing protein n=2 Tax=Steroidobacter denitrificans TaxID=465721 RepID=A0A127FB95_STEDE|nr:hypothetical protein ACG33_11395 [Steroidobacter denitrificans]
MWMGYGFIAAVTLAFAWLTAMPRNISAKRWHYAHAAIPLAAVLAFAVTPLAARATAQMFLSCGILILALVTLSWMVGQTLRNHSIMDIAYPIIIASVAGYALAHSASGLSAHAVTLFALVALWAARLIAHTASTNFQVEQEPYASLRRRFGAHWPIWSFFSVYVLQGTILWMWCLSIVLGMSATQGSFSVLDGYAVLVWLTGFSFQAVGDWQLRRFKLDPANAGKLMQQGLWALTRHPNYFGEALMAWAYFLFALQHSWGWAGLISPLYVTWFMGFGSAAPGNERHMRKTRPEYEAYAARVPKFWPRLPFLRR